MANILHDSGRMLGPKTSHFSWVSFEIWRRMLLKQQNFLLISLLSFLFQCIIQTRECFIWVLEISWQLANYYFKYPHKAFSMNLTKTKDFFFFFFYLLDSIYIFIFHHWWLLSKKKNSNLWRGRQVLKQWPMYFSVSSCGTYFSWLHISSNARKQCTPIEMNFRHF